MELHELPTDYVELLINIGFPILASLLFLAVMALAGAGAWGSFKRALKWARQYVDETNDLIIVYAGKKFHIPPEKASEIATKLIDLLLAQGEAVPLGELKPETLPSAEDRLAAL